MALTRRKPFCHICRTRRLPQKWDVIDRARLSRLPSPLCSLACRRLSARRMARHASDAEIEHLANRVAFTPRRPPKKFPVITESGAVFGSRRHKRELAEAENRAEDVALSRVAAKTWMMTVECADAGETLLQNRADAAEWMA